MIKLLTRLPGLVQKGLKNPNRVYRSVIFKFFSVLFPNHLLTPKLERGSFKMLVTPSDPGLSQQLYTWGWREEVETEFVKQFLGEGQVVIDVGANIGFYVLIESELIGASGKIIAVEPSALNVKLLNKNVSLNDFDDRVEVVQAGISNETGSGTLYMTKHYNLNSMNAGKLEKFTELTGEVEIPTYRLDDLLSERGVDMSAVDFVRMDVEGHEVDVIRGMSGLLGKAEKLGILMEVHPELIKENYGIEGYCEMLDTLKESGMILDQVAVGLNCRESQFQGGMDYADLKKMKGVYSILIKKKLESDE